MKSVGGDAVPITDYPSLLAHPRVSALQIITEVDHEYAGRFKTVRPVARISDTPDSIRLPPPTLSQHTQEILRAAGLSKPATRQ